MSNRGPSFLDTLLTNLINSIGGGLTVSSPTKNVDWGDHIGVSYNAETRTITIESVDLSDATRLTLADAGGTAIAENLENIRVVGPGVTIEQIDDNYGRLDLYPVDTTVDAVLLVTPTEHDGLMDVPTEEQADGVTITAGMRCLVREYRSGNTDYIWEHTGTHLEPAAECDYLATGFGVTVKHGNVYCGKRLTYSDDRGNGLEPAWQGPGVPTYAGRRAIAAAGNQEWFSLLTVRLIYNYVSRVTVQVRRASDSSYNISHRLFESSADFTYLPPPPEGSASVVYLSDPLMLRDPGETDVQACVRVSSLTQHTAYGYATFDIEGLKDAVAGTDHEYEVRVFVDQWRA
jgi:hypothetical protein